MASVTYRDFSDTAAQHYERFFVPSIATPVSRELLRTAALTPGARVLDVACGTGVVTRAAAERVGPTGAVTGVDIAPDMIAVAASVPTGGAPITWEEADAAALPLPDEHYDVGLCQMGLMFMEDRAGALAELRRVLRPGGRVVVNTPGHIQPVFEAMERAIADHLDPALGAFVSAVFSMADPTALGELVERAGFVDVGTREHTVALELPGPAELLWSYIDLTPMAARVAAAPPAVRTAMERQFIEATSAMTVDGGLTVRQPIALAWGRRP